MRSVGMPPLDEVADVGSMVGRTRVPSIPPADAQFYGSRRMVWMRRVRSTVESACIG
jgi:hypothetical protein